MTSHRSRLIKIGAILTGTLAVSACDPISNTKGLATEEIRVDVSVNWESGVHYISVELSTSNRQLELASGDKLVFKTDDGITELNRNYSSNKAVYTNSVLSNDGSVSVELIRASGKNGAVFFDFGSRAVNTFSYPSPFVAGNSSIALTFTGGGAHADLNVWLACSKNLQLPEELPLLTESDISTPYVFSVSNLLASYNNENGTNYQWVDLLDGQCRVAPSIEWRLASDPVVIGFGEHGVYGIQKQVLHTIGVE